MQSRRLSLMRQGLQVSLLLGNLRLSIAYFSVYSCNPTSALHIHGSACNHVSSRTRKLPFLFIGGGVKYGPFSSHQRVREFCSATAVASQTTTAIHNHGAAAVQESASNVVHYTTGAQLPRQNDNTLWLVVGDGDLSYSATLSEALRKDNISLIATVLEDEERHNTVYKRSKENTEAILSVPGQTVQFGVNATCLENHFPDKQFHRIIFNFPHWHGKTNNRYNRVLLDEFLASASRALSKQQPQSKITPSDDDEVKEEKVKGGEIHVALLKGQGGAEATTMQEWRRSWMAALYAAHHGLMLRRVEPFHASYNRSSHRGIDRGFGAKGDAFNYVFTFPSHDQPVEEKHQVAFRHELRIFLNEQDLASCKYSKKELFESDIVLDLARNLVPKGIVVEMPLRDIKESPKLPCPLLLFFVVYRGHSEPLTRESADQIRSILETAVKAELGLHAGGIHKPNRMVSKPFPYSLLAKLIEEYEP